ncbi:MAG: hypothetical protein ACJ8AT_18915, partial [Hyalangium sp.]|uniref:hypothetical protein n=1 Tax=Hyalangium sp. TaxID=2028555 RepID=UPI00389A5738
MVKDVVPCHRMEAVQTDVCEIFEAAIHESLENGLASQGELLRHGQRVRTVFGPPFAAIHRRDQLTDERSRSTFREHTLCRGPEELPVIAPEGSLRLWLQGQVTKEQLKLRRRPVDQTLQEHDEERPSLRSAKLRGTLL